MTTSPLSIALTIPRFMAMFHIASSTRGNKYNVNSVRFETSSMRIVVPDITPPKNGLNISSYYKEKERKSERGGLV